MAFLLLALVGVAGLAVWAVFDSRLLVVRSIVVTGTHLVPKSEVLDAADVALGTPLIRVNTAQVAASVETITQVRSAQVTRSWPDRLVITVRERTPAVAVTGPGGGFELVDASGVAVEWAARRPADLPLYVTSAGTSSLRGNPDLAAAAAVLGQLPASLRHAVRSVTVPSPDQVTLRLSSGVTVLWGAPGGTAAKAKELDILMRTHARYYDVRAPGAVVTK
jgi:cell division protein FtsQ